MENALFWLMLNFLTIITLAFFSMEEMACVSFNKIRLQYYVSIGNKNAIRIHHLLQNPATLFGTTLIGVNIATFVGSECARRFHEAIGLSPDLAPLSQVFLVIIFGELAPMFAARRYSEHVALLGVPLLTFAAYLLTPFIWVFGLLSKLVNKLFKGHENNPSLFLTEDELQKVIEDQDDERLLYQESEEINAITSNIFRLRHRAAREVMTSLTVAPLFSSQMSIGQLRAEHKLQDNFLIVFHKNQDHIIGIVYLKDLLRSPETKKLHEFCHPPWFIGLNTSLIQILKQFRRNTENIAIIINDKGKAIGYLDFEDILDKIFGKTPIFKGREQSTFIDRTFNGDMTLAQFRKEMGFSLPGEPQETLSEWLIRSMDHHPSENESLIIPPYEFIVKETSLLEIKTIEVKTHAR